jgi:hypothetical protein
VCLSFKFQSQIFLTCLFLSHVFDLLNFCRWINYLSLLLAKNNAYRGKNRKNCDVSDSSNIMAISYVAAQVFKHQIGSQFHAIPHAQVV